MNKPIEDPVDLGDLRTTVATLATLVIDLAAAVHALAPEQIDRLFQESKADMNKLRRRRAADPNLALPAEIASRRVELLRMAIPQPPEPKAS